ncbi:MAG TPA: glycosyl transferase family 90 [Chlamydiales bacterium]|nr:glycosyl transferase family 90 [Chlamydiales bacterium]
MKKLLAIALLLLIANLFWRARPVMGEKESYNAFFPKEKFLSKVNSPVPDWMAKQLDADFKDALPITAERVEKAHEVIFSKVPEPIFCYHYRIIDNQLYKYIPPGTTSSSRDSYFEKAFKTLLSHIRVPNVDFILIPMDGIPESFMEPNFYLLDDPRDQVPILGQAKLKEPLTRSVVLIPDQLSLSDSWYNSSAEILSINDAIPWSEKIGKAIWRGGVNDYTELATSPRLTLCRLSKTHPNLVDASFYSCEYPAARKLIEQENLLTPFISKLDQLHYRYLPALDGRMCTYPGFQWRLLSDALTLKQDSDQIQWFYSALSPYSHYLPLASDMSDILEKIQWAEEHPAEAQQMVANARQFITQHLMTEDCYRYLYLVFQKYATFQDIDFKALKRQTKRDPHWVNIQYRKREAVFKMLRRSLPKWLTF